MFKEEKTCFQVTLSPCLMAWVFSGIVLLGFPPMSKTETSSGFFACIVIEVAFLRLFL